MKLNYGIVVIYNSRSHPSRGAWIEIPVGSTMAEIFPSRTPRGVRGLKSTFKYEDGDSVRVAPLAGCVD